MQDIVRHEIASTAHTIVVKVGTRVLSRGDGTLDEVQIDSLAEQLNTLLASGKRLILVSSGAVGAGMSLLGLTRRPPDLATLQAVAAVGQARLIETYDRTLRRQNRHAAQVLLTAGDLDCRVSYLNVRNTLMALLDLGAVPIINENDTVAVDELMTTFGDNDRLAAMVTNLVQATLLVILSDVGGLFDGDPCDASSRIIPTVTQINGKIRALVQDRTATDRGGDVSKGGMASKIESARMATAAGENVIIASGREQDVLVRILAGESIGTLFLAEGKTISPWKRWIAFSAQPRGHVVLDNGATEAVIRRGSSLLAIGIVSVSGNFSKGDVISLGAEDGQEIARGLTNYTSSELARIHGLRSDRILATLGHCPYQEVIHRDNMVITVEHERE